MKLPLFKPARTLFCTCPPKYSLNTYLGRCAHGCIYCYAPKFPSFIGPPRPRTALLGTIDDMVEGTRERLPVMLSDCTDPYQPLELEHGITRRCIRVLAEHRFPLLIVTKSDLVTRDLDLFIRTRTTVAMTVTTLRDDVAALLEPHAPLPSARISALQEIADKGIPTVARVDPIVPMINDDEGDIEKLVKALAEAGVRQITTSTLKPLDAFLPALRDASPDLHRKVRDLYGDGKRIAGYRYLLKPKRQEIIERIRRVAIGCGLQFASCREGLPELNTSLCDGTAYCRV
jgi:DNA repair photolyase